MMMQDCYSPNNQNDIDIFQMKSKDHKKNVIK